MAIPFMSCIANVSAQLTARWKLPITYEESAPTTKQQPTRAKQLIGDIDSKLAEFTDKVLFGEVWQCKQLSKRDHSLVTIAALTALNRPDQLRSHMALALQNGVTQEELFQTITQLAFYTGWLNAVSAVPIARAVFKEADADSGLTEHPFRRPLNIRWC